MPHDFPLPLALGLPQGIAFEFTGRVFPGASSLARLHWRDFADCAELINRGARRSEVAERIVPLGAVLLLR